MLISFSYKVQCRATVLLITFCWKGLREISRLTKQTVQHNLCLHDVLCILMLIKQSLILRIFESSPIIIHKLRLFSIFGIRKLHVLS